jgi:hypothetical protein
MPGGPAEEDQRTAQQPADRGEEPAGRRRDGPAGTELIGLGALAQLIDRE